MPLKGALALAGGLLLSAATARAIGYEVFIDIDTEEDLYDLLVTHQISKRSFDALLLLHQTRIELNRAGREELYLLPNLGYADVDRILAYRAEAGAIHATGDLVAAGVLPRKLAESLRGFVSFRVWNVSRNHVDGFLRAQLRWTGRYDRLPPPMAIQARVRGPHNLDAGIVSTLTRNRVRRPLWDPVRNGLSVEQEAVRLEVPKVFVEWNDDRWGIVVGTYRIGFGQRLTFDATNQVTPNGFFGDYELRRENELGLRCRRGRGELPKPPCPDVDVARVTPDFTWTNRLTGIGMGVKRLPIGLGWLQAYAWGSYQVHRALGSELSNAGRCEDPRRDHDASCNPPAVYVRSSDPRSPAATVSHASLPGIVGEGLAGANVSYFWNQRAHLGVTGYGALPKWRVEGVSLDFQEHATKPFGGPFGAVGVNASAGFRRQDFSAEIARTFDRQAGGGGGYGVIARSVTSLAAGEIDVSVRYYAPRFANPYARPTSAPDERDGLRARDELGLRVRATTDIGPRLSLRALGDAWRNPSSGRLSGLLFARLDFAVPPSWLVAWWMEHRSASRKTVSAVQLGFAPGQRVSLSCQIQHRWLVGALATRRRQSDLAAVLNVTAQPIDLLRIRFRVRHEIDDLVDNHRLPQTLWGYVEASFTVRDRDRFRVRYDVRAHLDRRSSTLERVPNPEHWLWLEYVLSYRR